jgi:hypothetical protein
MKCPLRMVSLYVLIFDFILSRKTRTSRSGDNDSRVHIGNGHTPFLEPFPNESMSLAQPGLVGGYKAAEVGFVIQQRREDDISGRGDCRDRCQLLTPAWTRDALFMSIDVLAIARSKRGLC